MKKRKFINVLLIFIIVWCSFAIVSLFVNKEMGNLFVVDGKRPLLIAHGGGNHEFPDNTLEAFYNAYAIDPFVMLETDVSMTADGVIILSHDTTLDKKTSLIVQPIIDITYTYLLEEMVDFGYDNQVEPKSNGYNVSGVLKRYTNYRGEHVTPLDVTYPEGIIPRHDTRFLVTTLEDLIKAFPNNKINVEIKQSGDTGLLALDAVIQLMDALNQEYQTYERIVLASFHQEIFDKMIDLKKTTHPILMYSPSVKGVVSFFVLNTLGLGLFYQSDITVLQVPVSQAGIKLATNRFIKAAHRHDIAVHYWTIDDEATMRKLIALGADGIMTNRPTLLKQIIDEYDE